MTCIALEGARSTTKPRAFGEIANERAITEKAKGQENIKPRSLA